MEYYMNRCWQNNVCVSRCGVNPKLKNIYGIAI